MKRELDTYKIKTKDLTINQMLQEAYAIGIRHGKEICVEDMVERLEPSALNLGLHDMSCPPEIYRVPLTRKLQVIHELAPQKMQLRTTIRSVRDNSKDGQMQHILELYTSNEVVRGQLAELVYEMIRQHINKDNHENYSHQTAEHMNKATWI